MSRLPTLLLCGAASLACSSGTSGSGTDGGAGGADAAGTAGDGGSDGSDGSDAGGRDAGTSSGGSAAGNGGADGSAAHDAAPTTPVRMRVYVRNVSTATSAVTSTGDPLPVVFSPGVYLVHSDPTPWFEPGTTATLGIEHLAEEGVVSDVLAEIESRANVTAGFYGADQLNVSYDDAPIEPGMSADFVFDAKPGDHLELGMMWAQSNDVFVATHPGGIALFDGAMPHTGRVEAEMSLWDAGTEVNQDPGLGADQAPREAQPGDGQVEGGLIAELSADADAQGGYVDVQGFSYPSLIGMLEVELVLEP